MKITAVVPCLNEEKNIAPVYAAICQALQVYEAFEIIFIDDGSTDNTLKEIICLTEKDSRVKYISFSGNFGLEAAFRFGFIYASHEWCVQYDADMQFPPHETFKLAEKAEEGYDAIFGVRKKRKDRLYRTIGSKGEQFIAIHLLNIRIPKGASVFRMIKTSLAKRVIQYPADTAYFIATVPLVTSNYTTVEVEHRQRKIGKTNWKLSKMFAHSNELFFGFSKRPLFFAQIVLAVNVLLCAVLCIYALKVAPDLSWLAYVIGSLSISQTFSIGVLSQYAKHFHTPLRLLERVSLRATNMSNIPSHLII